MAAEGFPVARIGEYAKPCEPAIHVLRSVIFTSSALRILKFHMPLLRIQNEWQYDPYGETLELS